MRIPLWRLVPTGGALVVFLAAGIGVAFAGASTDAESLAPAGAAFDLDRPFRYGRSVVHGTLTIDDIDQGLVTIQLDGGAITAVDADSITLSEAGGASVTVAIDERTRVRIDRHRAEVGDLKAGQKVVICSRVADGGAVTARLIVVPPAESD